MSSLQQKTGTRWSDMTLEVRKLNIERWRSNSDNQVVRTTSKDGSEAPWGDILKRPASAFGWHFDGYMLYYGTLASRQTHRSAVYPMGRVQDWTSTWYIAEIRYQGSEVLLILRALAYGNGIIWEGAHLWFPQAKKVIACFVCVVLLVSLWFACKETGMSWAFLHVAFRKEKDGNSRTLRRYSMTLLLYIREIWQLLSRVVLQQTETGNFCYLKFCTKFRTDRE